MELGFVSNNPILENMIDYLVDEGCSEEEAILGKSNSPVLSQTFVLFSQEVNDVCYILI